MEPSQQLPPPPPPPKPQSAPEAGGHSSHFIDRSAQQSIYPQVDDTRHGFSMPPKPEPSEVASSGNSNSGITTPIAGIASYLSYALIVYLAGNTILAMVVGGTLALVAIVTAIASHYNNGRTSPAEVIGLSTATYTAIMIVNVLIAKAVIESSYGF